MARIAGLKTRRVLGLMSGTSCDGIDACVVAFTGRPPRLRWKILASKHVSYLPSFRRRLLRLAEAETIFFEDLPRMNVALGQLLGRVAREVIDELSPRQRPHFVASHGHTLRHLPNARPLAGLPTRGSFQIGEASCIAEIARCPVIADFRPADLAAGGQGAPLVAFVDRCCFSRHGESVVLLNLGGIANLSILPPEESGDPVLAFDTGPANMLIDGAISQLSRGRRTYDLDGRMAGRGKVHQPSLRRWLRDAYVRRRPPKTTGRERFGDAFLAATARDMSRAGCSDADWLATLTRFTAASVAWNLHRWAPGLPAGTEVLVCGGGSNNPVLMEALKEELAPARLLVLETRGVNADTKEAFSFALLGDEALAGRPTNLPSATGARHGVPLGKWSLPPVV